MRNASGNIYREPSFFTRMLERKQWKEKKKINFRTFTSLSEEKDFNTAKLSYVELKIRFIILGHCVSN